MAFFPPGFPHPNDIAAQMRMNVVFHQVKDEAEKNLYNRRYQDALEGYTVALNCAAASPMLYQEIPKQLCNKSMVLFKMRRFAEALADAQNSIDNFPHWIKGYWRASQVYKELGQTMKAVEVLIQGLESCIGFDSPQDDYISLFSELATILCQLRGDFPICHLSSRPLKEAQMKIIQRLANNKSWEAVSYLVTGLCSGTNTELACSFHDLDFSFVHVANLLQQTSISQQQNWGLELAIELLKKGASYQVLEYDLGQAAIHIGIESALKTGSLDFLKFLFSTYIDSIFKKDMYNKNGDTAMHVVVKSGRSNSTFGESLLRLLLNNGCTGYLKDMSGKMPIEYLEPTDQGYKLLQTTKQNADEAARKRVTKFKNEGNQALKQNNYGNAIQMYTKGLSECGDNCSLKLDRAKLLTNRSNVYNTIGRNKEALKDAEEAIKSDKTWFKGYWRRGTELKLLNRTLEAYNTFLDMLVYCNDIQQAYKVNSLTEAATLFKDIPDKDKKGSYNRLMVGDGDVWSTILNKLSRSGDWLTIRYLIMKFSTNDSPAKTYKGEGVGANSDTSGMSFGTVFTFLKSVKHMKSTEKWLTATLVVLLYRHGTNYLNFKIDDKDTCVHAVVRYSLITGSLTLLALMPITGTPFREEYLDGRKETPYHMITKYKHTSDEGLMVRVARQLIEKKYTASMKDAEGNLAIDYINQSMNVLRDVMVKVSWKLTPKAQTVNSGQMANQSSTNVPSKNGSQPKSQTDRPKPNKSENSSNNSVNPSDRNADSMDDLPSLYHDKPKDTQRLKEIGNSEFKKGNYKEAASLYTEAIGIEQAKKTQEQNRDLAILFANRTECFLKLGMFDKAMQDATESVSNDGHWFKGHMKVGKVLGALDNHEGAVQAYANALNELASEPSPQKFQREILATYCYHFINLDKHRYPLDSVNVDVPQHIWALVTYDFICKAICGSIELVLFAYMQFKTCKNRTQAKNVKENLDLQPLCIYDLVKEYNFVLDLIEYFLDCGSNVETMVIQNQMGEKYVHSAVRLTMASDAFVFLERILSKYVRPRGDSNIVDSRGNTSLHTIARTSTVHPMTRLRIVVLLLDAEVNPLLKNKDQKYAIHYIPKNEFKVIQIIDDLMTQQDEMEKRMKQQKMTQQQKQQQQERKTQSQSKQTYASKPSQASSKPDPSWLPQAQPSQPQRDKCQECEKVLEECKTKIKTTTLYAYNDMARILRINGHDKVKHKKIVDEMIQMITSSIAKTLNPEIPVKLAKIPYKLYERIVDGLKEGEYWRQLDVVVEEHRKHHGPMDLPDYAKGVKIQRVILHSSLKGSHQLMVKIIESMLKCGAVMENGGKKCVMAAVQEEQFKILETLFNNGACPSHLSVNQGDTPIHAALSIAIERDRGNFSLFNMFLELFEKDPEKYHMCDPNLQDQEGNSLFHLIAKIKYNSTVQKATEILCDKKNSSNVKNNEGKLPIHYLNQKNDRRLQFFRLASVGSSTKSSQKKTKGSNQAKKSKSGTNAQADIDQDKIAEAEQEDLLQFDRAEDAPEVVEKPAPRIPLRKEAMRRKIEDMIYELDDAAYSKFSSRAEDLQKRRKQKVEKVEPKIIEEKPVKEEENQEPEKGPADQEPVPKVDDEESSEEESQEEHFQFDPQVFENLEWEVECTADVWKALRDKHVLPDLKQRIVRKIQHLAAGEWTHILCKKLHHVPDSLKLYEAKISKGGRIIWELAIAFSPRLSESAERILESEDDKALDQPVRGGRIYSEIIRVWDIVFDHDKIFSSVQRIIKSHTRGESCIIQKKLKGVKHEKLSNKQKRVPRIYAEMDIEKTSLEEVKPFFPPASSNETEYHILKFYSFSSNLVSHILQNIEIKVDFPFRVTDLEHAIINLQSNAPILLLGRSGTGKTTCCLYRLWSRFLWYWTKAKEADAPLLPRALIYRQQEQKNNEEEQEEEEELEEEAETVCIQEEVLFERQTSNDNQEPSGSTEGASACALEPENNENVDENDNETGQLYDHLHQIFITKNAVLCNEVQKNFRELMHACDIAKNHVEVENQNVPNKLQDVSEYQFPLFITSRQLLLMLDASLGAPYFFDRTEDGSLKVDIQGWTDGDGPLSILPLLQEESDSDESDSEDEDINLLEEEADEDEHQDNKRKKKVDPRKEMTYELFAESIWPHINKGIGKKYHPSLVWTEIMSFIKGSYEALAKPSGHLDKDEYLELGRKRAPNFTGARDHIYTLFLRYEHKRKQKFLFDETDLVRDIYHRVCQQGEMNWVIHQIFVDETQDFTQAELCLLLRLCQNPNEMFLTGDTAQSIMRGISFRFSDLKSLFFYASKSLQVMGKASGVAIPKQVYQLTHNYRSHAGILSLASSILDLMIEFFPESFDRLNKDQGLFHGPNPVLLESCSFSDLALLLRGNKRKTSHIEFGAHQAILVVNDAARENVPEELQYGLILTIYESKGLEFDDILLYNFFKDSQASKEWRVVTDFLEKLFSNAKPGTESLVEVSSEVLQQKDRPRPLTFDPNQHKVLNSELKHLYTAVTRARVNVWIFDEDMDKRAPMFEYFKARNLVKAISNQDVQNLSTGGMFAEESTPEQWIKRADDFMKHNLYEVAAKCYKQGKDPFMEKVAMSHQQALNASRMKDNPSKMKDEFLIAALQYLEIKMPVYAAKCLQNARERELLAHLYEKMGQLEQAAETYRKLHRPIESSACYERLGFFNKAIDILNEHEMFDMAIDTLRRFKMLKKEYEEKGQAMPQQLKEHAPRAQHTEERLSYKAAKMYHRAKNTGKMLAALNRLSKFQDKVDFLREHHNHTNGYMSLAAKIYSENGEIIKAAELYMDQGQIDKALELARDVERKDLIGFCLFVQARMETKIHRDGHATSENVDGTVEKLKQAFDIFKNYQKAECYKFINPLTGAGEAAFMLGQLTNNIEWIKTSFGNFGKVKPSRNEAAQLDCMNWMVYNSDLSARENLFQVVKGMENLYGVLLVLLNQRLEDKARLDQIFRFYGLEPFDEKDLVYNPTQKPRINTILKYQGKPVDKKAIEVKINIQEARRTISKYLLNNCKEWYNKLRFEFEQQHRKLGQCPLFMVGIENFCKKPCVKGYHSKLSENAFNKLIELDLLFIELEYYVDKGSRGTLTKMGDELKAIQESFYNPKTTDIPSCQLLLDDILSRFCRIEGSEFTNNSEALRLKKYFAWWRKNFILRDQLFKMLKNQHDLIKDHNNRMRERNTDYFMKMVLVIKFFSMPKELLDVQTVVFDFEQSVLEQFHGGYLLKRNLEDLGFLVENKDVHCLVRRFIEAYDALSSMNNDTETAIRSFSKFIQLIRKLNYEQMLPDLDVMLMWIEFYAVISFSFECKIAGRRDMYFVIPSSYLAIMNLIEATYLSDKGVPTFEAINRRSHFPERDLIKNRTDRLVGILSGADRRINLIRLAFHQMTEAMVADQAKQMNSIDDSLLAQKMVYSDHTLACIANAERMLIASLVFVCNMGMTVYEYSETHVIREICRIQLPTHSPGRLVQAVESVKTAKGISDIVVCLRNLLLQRDDNLFQCWWQPRQEKRHGIVIERGVNMRLFSPVFFKTETFQVLQNPNLVLPTQVQGDDEEIAMTAEEKAKVKEDQKNFEEKQKKNKAAHVILKFFKHVKFLSNCQNAKEICEKEIIKRSQMGSFDIFKDVIVNEKMCGICGEYFKDRERESGIDEDQDVYQYQQPQPVVVPPESPTPRKSISPTSFFQKFKQWTGLASESNPQTDTSSLSYSESLSQPHLKQPEQHEAQGFGEDDFPTLSRSMPTGDSGLTPLQLHQRSLAHQVKQDEFIMFKKKYNSTFKKGIENARDLIEMYELRSPRAAKMYDLFMIDIIRLVSKFDDMMNCIRRIKASKSWSKNPLQQLFMETMSEITKSEVHIKNSYQEVSKPSAMKNSAQYLDEDNQYYEDEAEEIEEVVRQPQRREFFNSKIKRGRKGGRHKT